MQNNDTTDYDEIGPTAQHVLNQHAREISVHSRSAHKGSSRSSPVSIKRKASHVHAIVHFVRRTLSNYTFALLTSPQTVLADPVGAGFALVVLPVIHIALFFTQIVFLIGGHLGGAKVGEWFSEEFGFGLSAVNMLDPSMFEEKTSAAIHIMARKGLSNAYGYPDIASMPDPNENATPNRYFNLDIAKSLILLCAVVYEREDTYVTLAGQIAKKDELSDDERQRQVAQFLLRSSKHIRDQASKWGMHFSSVSDFVSVGGPFCGLFWPKESDPSSSSSSSEKWIVIAFKGTSPTNVSEFMIDATIAHHNAHSFFGNGAVHQGFYTSLAPGAESDVDPYANILHSLKHVAKSMRKEGGEKVNLWITGHSLGAALSSLLYARLLFSPKDLGEDLVLRQGYMYGTPRVADADFISEFDWAASTPFGDTTQSMWRIIDRWDIVTHVPPGLADSEENRAVLPSTSLLNYGHFGTAGVRLTGSNQGSGWEIESGTLRGGSAMQIVQSQLSSTAVPMKQGPILPKTVDVLGVKVDPIGVIRYVASLAGPGADHMPSNYYARLQQVKADVLV